MQHGQRAYQSPRRFARIVPAAGVPWFVALFGRDSLVASLQTVLVYSGFACGALDVLGALWATQKDDYRDAASRFDNASISRWRS